MQSRPWRRLYNTQEWHRLRTAQLRDEPLCKYCLEQGRTEAATVVDHVIPHRGDRDLFFNGKLASLCKKCHDGAKQRLEKSGYLVGHDVLGTPLDKNHHWNKN